MSLILQNTDLQTIIAEAERTYPEECCGLLLGIQAPDKPERQVYELYPLRNEWSVSVNPFAEDTASERSLLSKRNRFWVDPRSLLEAQRYCRDRGWVVLGVYHSHPDHSAEPSERDRQLAWTEYSYPIVSVQKGKFAAIASWRINEGGEFVAEAIVAEPPAMEQSP